MHKIDILIVSNKLDFTTDYVCMELQKRNAKYFRINRDDFEKYQILFDVDKETMTIEINDDIIFLDNTLKAIYYRAPIYLRDIYKPNISKEEQLYRTQWAAFIRNLTFFDNVIWVNNPSATFKAENKILQLKYAKSIGLLCPKTLLANTSNIDINKDEVFIVKTLDTGILRIGDKEAFIYSNVVTGNEIKSSNLSLAPIIIQEYLQPKIDVRVTIIGNKVYAVKIMKNSRGIDGDWRREKNDVRYVPFSLPKDIETKCIELLKRFGLAFGGIDLIQSNDMFYFLEVNPTGEWAWLVNCAQLEIYLGICDFLEGKSV